MRNKSREYLLVIQACELLSVLFHINCYHHHHHITATVFSNREKSKQPNAGKVLGPECISESPGGRVQWDF